MRISDWSSDVCSSDLGKDVALTVDHDQAAHLLARLQPHATHAGRGATHRAHGAAGEPYGLAVAGEQHDVAIAVGQLRVDQGIALGEVDRDLARSEERRGGKEGVSTCRSRWARDL